MWSDRMYIVEHTNATRWSPKSTGSRLEFSEDVINGFFFSSISGMLVDVLMSKFILKVYYCIRGFYFDIGKLSFTF